MSDLKFKHQRFEKILYMRTYYRSPIERKLNSINKKIAELENFLENVPSILKNLRSCDNLLVRDYIDYLNYQKKESFKILASLKEDYRRYYASFVNKYREEEKIKILIKILNNFIIKDKRKKENLLLYECVNYKVCEKLRMHNE